MSIPIPDLADPWSLVQNHSHFAGVARRDSLVRLTEAVQEIVSDLEYRLRFSLDEAKRPQIEGAVRVRVTVTCQRCLEALVLDLDSAFQLTLVATEAEADRLADDLDVVVLPEQPMRILDLLEDELLLSLPTVASHPRGTCGMPEAMASTESAVEALGDRSNPFAVLATLKNDLNET
jgi:uncharacterized protein